jgi:hypothetical protein
MKQYLKLAAATALVVAGANAAYAQAKKPAAAAAKPATAAKPVARSTGGALLGGHPNLNGVWQVINEANYSLEPHDSSTSKAGERQLGAIAANHGGLGVVEGGVIPYKPDALKIRDSYRASAPKYDPEAACYLPGIPRATYMSFPFQIIQAEKGNMLMVYEYANANRAIYMGPTGVPAIDTWMGTSYGSWEGNTLKIVTLSQSPGEYKAPAGEMMENKTWLDRSGNFIGSNTTVTEKFAVVDKDHIAYEATISDPELYTKDWKIKMTLYRRMEPNAELMDFRCVPYSEEFLYGDLHETAPAK